MILSGLQQLCPSIPVSHNCILFGHQIKTPAATAYLTALFVVTPKQVLKNVQPLILIGFWFWKENLCFTQNILLKITESLRW